MSNLKCPKCGSPGLHPCLKIPGTNQPRVLIYQNKRPGKHMCLVCSGYYRSVTFECTWEQHDEEKGWFNAEEQEDASEGILTDMRSFIFEWLSQFIPAEDAQEMATQVMLRPKILNAMIASIREENETH